MVSQTTLLESAFQMVSLLFPVSQELGLCAQNALWPHITPGSWIHSSAHSPMPTRPSGRSLLLIPLSEGHQMSEVICSLELVPWWEWIPLLGALPCSVSSFEGVETRLPLVACLWSAFSLPSTLLQILLLHPITPESTRALRLPVFTSV